MSELVPPVTIVLDKERHLRLTLKGLVEFEKLTGKNLLKGFNLDDLTLEDNAALIWACLLHEDKELTFEAVLSMIDLSNFSKVTGAVLECINRSLPEVKTDNRPLVKKSRRG